jgi:hypothetical protein
MHEDPEQAMAAQRAFTNATMSEHGHGLADLLQQRPVERQQEVASTVVPAAGQTEPPTIKQLDTVSGGMQKNVIDEGRYSASFSSLVRAIPGSATRFAIPIRMPLSGRGRS